uniref:hypothetical protein n=1 Tax=Polaromonas sp. TaxID=1869339 RepID=UPI002FC88635
YARGGAWAYLAAVDVHRAKVFGRCEATTGIEPFERLVNQVMSQWPYNQIEIYFSIVQCKALTPNDFTCLQAVADRLENFERYYESIAHPFEWKFTRADLNALMARMRSRYAETQHLKLAA